MANPQPRYVNAPMSFDDVYSQIEAIGAATGNIGEAAELVLEMQTEIEELTANAFGGSGLSYFHELDNTLYSKMFRYYW